MLFTPYTLVTLSVVFSGAGVNLDPTTVTLSVANSEADTITVLTYGVDADIVRDDTGEYHCDYLPPNSGSYSYQWRGTGTVIVATEAAFQVSPTIF